jgi:DNA-binding NarL/FixJ family response regulator
MPAGAGHIDRHNNGVPDHGDDERWRVSVDSPIRVMVIDDHPLFRDALCSRILQVRPDTEFTYQGASIADALAQHALTRADCAVLDLDLGDSRSPVTNTAELVDAGCKVLVVSALADPATVRSALRVGALGFVSKQSDSEEFAHAFLQTLQNEPSTSRDVAAILANDETVSVPLTERERTAMVLYASGLTIDAVARRMDVKPATAQEYIKRVRGKYLRAGTAIPSKTDLYRKARDEGLLP